MDNYWNNKLSDYFLTMANLEARQLYNKANEVSLIHLKNGFTQMNFLDDVKRFIDHQLQTMQSTKSEDVRQECLANLQVEHKNISIQDQMLRSGQAALHASVQFIKSDGVCHWIINGVGIVLSSLQIVAGLGVIAVSAATVNIIGIGFGALLSLHGFNGIVESSIKLKTGRNDATGTLKNVYIAGAEFLGFDQKVGEMAYTAMDLGLSVYGLARLVLKPQTYRLFHYLSTDYVRGIKDMSRFDLGVEIYNDSRSLKSMYDDMNGD
jgi:hypothetical protein